MVDWHDPSFLLKDYISFVKLNHAIAGIYIWETVFSAGFELDVLRRKRPYRWTIWLYLGTRYIGLLAFICLFVDMDGPRVSCKAFMTINFALFYTSWAFASLIIVLRVIAIWDRNIIVSLLAISVWAGGIALHIRNLTMIVATYHPVAATCVVLHMRRVLVNTLGVLVVDTTLLLTMLIGLLRYAHRNLTGIWMLLYRQCIIWLALALFAEIPPVVILLLDLNNAWDGMLIGPAIAVLSISAARMYRSLSDCGSLTECTSSDLPKFSPKTSVPTVAQHGGRGNIYGPMHLASVRQLEGPLTTPIEALVFLPAAEQVLEEFVPGESISNLAHEYTRYDDTDSHGYETS